MPPPLSDEENDVSSGEEEVPARAPHSDAENAEDPEDNEEQEDDGEPEDDEYVVEKIERHRTRGGVIEYNVKWMGYDKPSDMTWEPESNLSGALEILHEYWDKIGGRPGLGKKRRGRKSAVGSESGTPAAPPKRIKKEEGEWAPPPGSWENDVDYVDTVEETIDPKSGDPKRYAYLIWRNGKKTQHPLGHIYHKCPQKMLLYYEQHLVFTQSETNGTKDEIMSGNY